jgi:hypothetical protein
VTGGTWPDNSNYGTAGTPSRLRGIKHRSPRTVRGDGAVIQQVSERLHVIRGSAEGAKPQVCSNILSLLH